MTARRSEVSQDAREDLALQYTWYMNQAGSSIAERYLSAFEQSVRALTLQPEMGMPRRFRDRRLIGIRSIQMHGAFRVHLLFYPKFGNDYPRNTRNTRKMRDSRVSHHSPKR